MAYSEPDSKTWVTLSLVISLLVLVSRDLGAGIPTCWSCWFGPTQQQHKGLHSFIPVRQSTFVTNVRRIIQHVSWHSDARKFVHDAASSTTTPTERIHWKQITPKYTFLFPSWRNTDNIHMFLTLCCIESHPSWWWCSVVINAEVAYSFATKSTASINFKHLFLTFDL
jgi:hypothetical protein